MAEKYTVEQLNKLNKKIDAPCVVYAGSVNTDE